MKQIILTIALLTILGCQIDDFQNSNEINEDSLESKTVNLIEPAIEFVEFVTEIQVNGWISDTLRIKKVKLYNLVEMEIQKFKNLPFYNIPYKNTQFHHILGNNPTTQNNKSDLTLSKVKQIWGYYYRDKNETNWISDGVIEEWCYSDSVSARLAFNELQKHGNYVYFNTMPYFLIKEKSVFVFNTRAMAFSYDQKPLFDKFTAKTER